METEKIAEILIYIHAGFGGIALLTGGIALIVKKGNNILLRKQKFYSIFSYNLSIYEVRTIMSKCLNI